MFLKSRSTPSMHVTQIKVNFLSLTVSGVQTPFVLSSLVLFESGLLPSRNFSVKGVQCPHRDRHVQTQTHMCFARSWFKAFVGALCTRLTPSLTRRAVHRARSHFSKDATHGDGSSHNVVRCRRPQSVLRFPEVAFHRSKWEALLLSSRCTFFSLGGSSFLPLSSPPAFPAKRSVSGRQEKQSNLHHIGQATSSLMSCGPLNSNLGATFSMGDHPLPHRTVPTKALRLAKRRRLRKVCTRLRPKTKIEKQFMDGNACTFTENGLFLLVYVAVATMARKQENSSNMLEIIRKKNKNNIKNN